MVLKIFTVGGGGGGVVTFLYSQNSQNLVCKVRIQLSGELCPVFPRRKFPVPGHHSYLGSPGAQSPLLRWNRTYIDSMRMAENRRIWNIRHHSRAFLHKLTSNRVIVRTDFHIQYSPIFLSIFVYSTNLEVPRMYSARNNEYGECANILICTLLVHLFLPNILGYSPRISICVMPPLTGYPGTQSLHSYLQLSGELCPVFPHQKFPVSGHHS